MASSLFPISKLGLIGVMIVEYGSSKVAHVKETLQDDPDIQEEAAQIQ